MNKYQLFQQHAVATLLNLPAPVVAALITLAGLFLMNILINKWRDRVAARERFRKVFIPILAEFDQGKIDRMSVGTAINEHDVAIKEFSFHLSGRKRIAFNHDCEQYHQCRNRCLATGEALIAVSIRRAMDGVEEPKTNALAELKKSIEQLMDHTC